MGVFLRKSFAITKCKLLFYKHNKMHVFGMFLHLAFLLISSVFFSYTIIETPVSKSSKMDLKKFKDDKAGIAIVLDLYSDLNLTLEFEKGVKNLFEKEGGFTPVITRFRSKKLFNEYLVEKELNQSSDKINYIAGYEFIHDQDDIIVNTFYNNSYFSNAPTIFETFEIFYKVLWNFSINATLDYEQTIIPDAGDARKGRLSTCYHLAIMMIMFCFTNATQLFEWLQSDRIAYLYTCQVSKIGFYLGYLLADWISYAIASICFCISFWWYPIGNFASNMITIMIGALNNGFSILILLYAVCSFLPNQYYMIVVFPLLFVPVALIIGFAEPKTSMGYFLCGLYPPTNIIYLGMKCTENNHFKLDLQIISMLMASIGSGHLYFVIFAFVSDFIRERKIYNSKKEYERFTQFFNQIKSQQNITEEAIAMEQNIDNEEYYIKLKHISKIFFKPDGDPVAAVNDVTLGIKENEILGFLGANGAGKTTLISIMASYLANDSGDFEYNEPYAIGYCPQFNTHIPPYLTPLEALDIFGKIFNCSREILDTFKGEYMQLFEMEEHKDKMMSELSGGTSRKVAILIAFLSPYHLLLLDEPTSSLDPVSRRKVHQLINKYRGSKTFMLCTHLLDEAEMICDRISMMINGCIYTVGTPQYLTSKFGTEWKVSLSVNDIDRMETVKIAMAREFPDSSITVERPLSLVYSISSSVSAAVIFMKLKELKENNDCIKHYTCSSSNLDKVFTELVIRSENNRH